MPDMMKTRSLFQSATAARALYATLMVLSTALLAETPLPTPQKQTDPFIKKESAPEAKPTEQALNLCLSLEVYSLDQNDAAKLLGENPGGPARHDRVRELVTKGKARLETVLSDVTKPGQRSVVEQIDEVRYGNEFQRGCGQEMLPRPIVFETRNVGDTFEWEPVLGAGNQRCDLNLVVCTVRFGGFVDFLEPQQKLAFAQPRFDTRKITTSQSLPVGGMQLLGTLSGAPHYGMPDGSNADKKGGSLETRLLFGRIDTVRLAPQPAQPRSMSGVLEHHLSFFSLDREAARIILGEVAKPGAVYAAVQPLLERKEARLERLLVLKTKSGQRATIEEIEEVRYLAGTNGKTENEPADRTKAKQAPGLDVWETRNTGLTLEIDSALAPDGALVDMTLVPQFVRLLGNLQVEGIAQKYLPQPVFETRKVTTSLCAALGEQAFIGTFNQPADTGVNGQKDTGRVWLGFIQTKLVRE